MPDSLERFYNVVFVSWDYYYRPVVRGWMYSVAAVGMVARFIGVILGLGSLFMFWKSNKGFFEIKKWVAAAISLESLYYASLTPSLIFLFVAAREFGFSYTLGIAYFLQILFTVPFLAVLAFKVYKYEREPNGFQSWTWVGFAFSGYVATLWANAVLRWLDMALDGGFAFLLSEFVAVGFFNAVIFMSLAVVFAVVGAFSLAKHKSSVMRWLGLALAMVGLHYVIYVVFSYIVNTLNSVWLIDVWAIPLLGLGLTLLKKQRT